MGTYPYTGGNGGGGNGSYFINYEQIYAKSGSANTGCGGGCGTAVYANGSGGSGIVIIRWGY